MKYLNLTIKFLLFVLFLTTTTLVSAQSELKLGDNVGTKNTSAILEMESKTKGLLLPRMTTVEMNAIVAPVNGLMIYNTDLNCIHYFFGGWKSQCDAANLGAWSILGNAGTIPTTNFLGTADNQDLWIKTNGNGRMRIGKNGHIGLGNYANQPIDNISLLWNLGTNPIAFNLQDSISDFSTGLYQGMVALIKVKPAANWAGNAYAGNFDIHTPSNYTGNLTGGMIGYAGDVRHFGSGTVGYLTAANNAITNSGTGTVTNAYGWNGYIINNGTGTLTNAYGIYSAITRPTGTLTNGYAFYAPDVEATNGFGMYQDGVNDLNYFAGNTGIGISLPTSKFHTSATQTAIAKQAVRFDNTITGTGPITNGLWDWSGHFNNTTIAPTAASSNWYTGSYDLLRTSSSNLTNGTMVASAADAKFDGTGTLGALAGTNPFAQNTSTGTVTSAIGSEDAVGNTSTGTIVEGVGVRGWVFNSGAGTINTAKGVLARVVNAGTGTLTNGYGLFVEDVQATNQFGLYQVGTNDLNYFAGKTGVGNTSPTNQLHVTATTNPVRFEGLQSGASTDSIVTVDATGVLRKRTAISLVQNNAWGLKGNSGTTATTNFLGTTDLQSIRFRTNNLQRMMVDSLYGNLGIGANAFSNAKVSILYPELQTDAQTFPNGIYIETQLKQSTTGAKYGWGINSNLTTNIPVGVTSTGWYEGIRSDNYRNKSTDGGTLTTSTGMSINYGHTGGLAATAVTKNSTGLQILSYRSVGTIDSLRDLHIRTGTLGGTVNNHWAIYQEEKTAKNYFAGNVGIATATPNSTVQVAGSFSTAIRTITPTVATTSAVTTNDYTIIANCTSAALTLTLPAASTCIGRTYIIKKMDATNSITFSPALTLDLSQNITITTMASTYMIQSDGTNWLVVNRF